MSSTGELTDAQWARLERLFDEALDLPADEREAFVLARCRDDAQVAERLQSMLRSSERADEQLVSTLMRAVEDLPDPRIGQTLGPYRVIALIGQGGMGSVYLGERADAVFTKRVAIKIIRANLADVSFARRFLLERQILAQLEHPYIARLLDGGSTEDGLPYLVLEFVVGEPLDQYCDRLQLGVRERLQLFLKVLEAVSYAHRNLVVHRDLKPSNVLVTEDGLPKLLDFGIAKLLGGAIEASAPETRPGMRTLTPEYASPEQLLGTGVSTATDLYALGVVLYELLAGRGPYRADASTPAALQRAIVEVDPERPSERVRHQESGEAGQVSQARGTRRERLQGELAGDLDNIVMMALRKEPERRYGSVDALRRDIEQYLAGMPVSAQPSTFAYRARRFIGRHRAATAIASTLAAFVLALAVTSTVQAVRIGETLAEVEQEAARTRALSGFLTDLLREIDPARSDGEVLTLREFLDQAARRLETDTLLDRDPRLETELRLVLGSSYRALAAYDAADHQLQEALALTDNGPPRDRARALWELANLRQLESRLPEAEQRAVEAMSLARGEFADGSDVTDDDRLLLADTIEEVGVIRALQNRLEEAEALFAEVIDIRESVLGTQHVDFAEALVQQGTVAIRRQKLQDARDLLQQALDVRIATGVEDPALAVNQSRLGFALCGLSQLGEGLQHHDQAVMLMVRLYGENHPRVAGALSNQASCLSRHGEHREAARLHERALAIHRTLTGPGSRFALATQHNMAIALKYAGEYAAAESSLVNSIAGSIQLWGEDHPSVALARYNLADLYLEMRRYREALELATLAEVAYSTSFGRDHAARAYAVVAMGMAHRHLGDLDRAVARLEEGEAILVAARGEIDDEVMLPQIELCKAERQRGNLVAARRWCDSALRMQLTLDPEHPRMLRVYRSLAELTRDEGWPEHALTLARQALVFGARLQGEAHPQQVETLEILASIPNQPPGVRRDYLEQALPIARTAYGADSEAVRDLLRRIELLADEIS
ncbi:MAG: serine/threonine-protein kinase [Gammaproteobacteria bacterium]|nr:serine/threonine-protein kinase [Gammaproteobacteria bacterium]